jgi:hypothetical protein
MVDVVGARFGFPGPSVGYASGKTSSVMSVSMWCGVATGFVDCIPWSRWRMCPLAVAVKLGGCCATCAIVRPGHTTYPFS